MDGITTVDRGVVQGDTWHNKLEYVRQKDPVSLEQCKHVFDYPLEIVPLQMGIPTIDENRPMEFFEVAGANCVFRPDINRVLVPHVGDRFRLLEPACFINWVMDTLLAPYPELHIESCGTLYEGQTRFISIVLDEHQVAGDDSQLLDRILFTDPVGEGAYKACMNQIRVVCDNTRRLGIAQGKKNLSYLRVSHTENGVSRIKQHMLDLAEIRMGLGGEHERMDWFATIQFGMKDVADFFDTMYPIWNPDGTMKEGRALTIAVNKRGAVRSIFESGQNGLSESIRYTAYGLFNALTDFLGNQNTRNDYDIDLDNMIGHRADTKDAAMGFLMQRCRELKG